MGNPRSPRVLRQSDCRAARARKLRDLLGFIRPVFVDTQRRSQHPDDAALGGMQRRGAAREARGEAPALHRPVQQQGEAGLLDMAGEFFDQRWRAVTSGTRHFLGSRDAPGRS